MKHLPKILMLLCVLSAFGLMACDTDLGGTPSPTPSATPVATVPVTVTAMLMGNIPVFGGIASVDVTSSGVDLSTLTVTVNGTTLPFASGSYGIALASLTPGSTATLAITGPGVSVSGTIRIPETPVISSPTAAHGNYIASSDIGVAWAAFATDPDIIGIYIDDAHTVAGEYAELADTMTGHTIPGGVLSTNLTAAVVQVQAQNILMLSGAQFETSGISGIMALNSASSEAFTTAP